MAKFIKPFVKRVYNIPATQQIEVAGRTCTNSFSKVTPTSDEKFCKSMIKKGHEAVIEFATFTLKFKYKEWANIKHSNPKFLTLTSFDNRYIISGNARAWRDYIKEGECDVTIREYILYKFKGHVLFEDIAPKAEVNLSNTNIQIEFLDDSMLIDKEIPYHQYLHFYIVTDRGVMAELTRHRPVSFAIQSTRYVSFKTGCEFIIPQWFYNNPKGLFKKIKHSVAKKVWRMYCRSCERGYKLLLMFGLKPQDARGVLPNSLKTIINISTNKKQYDIIFNLRSHKAAHPDIRHISDKMKNKDYEIFKWSDYVVNSYYYGRD